MAVGDLARWLALLCGGLGNAGFSGSFSLRCLLLVAEGLRLLPFPLPFLFLPLPLAFHVGGGLEVLRGWRCWCHVMGVAQLDQCDPRPPQYSACSPLVPEHCMHCQRMYALLFQEWCALSLDRAQLTVCRLTSGGDLLLRMSMILARVRLRLARLWKALSEDRTMASQANDAGSAIQATLGSRANPRAETPGLPKKFKVHELRK